MAIFDTLGIKCNFHGGVQLDDPRLKFSDNKKSWSLMYGHLDLINEFYHKSEKEFGIFCEDDICIHKDFLKNLPLICEDFKSLNLDILLLGYLLPLKLNNEVDYNEFPLIKHNNNINFDYYTFPNNLWGTQMFMLSKKQAKYLLDKYYDGYADKSLDPQNNLAPFSSDWTITKEGNRAIIMPIIALEDGLSLYNDAGKKFCHEMSHKIHYDKEIYI